MFISKHSCAFAILSTFVGLAAGSTGCSASPSDNANVSGRGEIINHTKSALANGAVTAVSGTYGATCNNHVSGAAWSTAGGSILVDKNDANCRLTMTGLSTATADYVGVASATILMDLTYPATATAFTQVGGDGSIAFYSNAEIDTRQFDVNFVMTVKVSDDPSETDAGAKAAGWATRSGTASAGTIPASNYTFDLTSGAFALTKDVNGIVDAVSGYAQLTAGGTPLNGEDYAIVTGAPATFNDVDAAFSGGSILSLPGNLQLPASGFGLVTTDLTSGQVRTLIIRHTDAGDGGSGVSSYQTFTITFTL